MHPSCLCPMQDVHAIRKPRQFLGDIYINGETSHEYGHDKKEPFFHQRFVIAHD